MLNRSGNIAIVAALFVLLISFSMLTIIYYQLRLSSDELGDFPNIRVDQTRERPAKGCWVSYGGTRYDVWDVRDKLSLNLIFSVVLKQGKIVTNNDQFTKAIAIRLSMQMAHIVEKILSGASDVENLAQTIVPMIEAGIEIAKMSGQAKVARELTEFKLDMKRIGKLAEKIATVLELVGPPAAQLLKEHTDARAEEFLQSLLVSSCSFSSRSVRLVIFTVTSALTLLGASIAEWLDSLYDMLAEANVLVMLSALSFSYGSAEFNKTLEELSRRN